MWPPNFDFGEEYMAYTRGPILKATVPVKKKAKPKPKIKSESKPFIWERGTMVQVRPDSGYSSYEGVYAVVLRQDGDQTLIQFEKELPGLHNGHGDGAEGRCWFISSKHLIHHSDAKRMLQKKKRLKKTAMPKVAYSWPHGEDAQVTTSADPNVEEHLFEGGRKLLSEEAKIRIAKVVGVDVPDEPPEIEEVEEDRGSGTLSAFKADFMERMDTTSERETQREARIRHQYSTGVVPKPKQRVPKIGQLCMVRKADGSRSMYDNVPALVLAAGTFGRLLIQFERPMPKCHDGKGAGEPGRCLWFYKKDIVGITMGEAAEHSAVIGRTRTERPRWSPPKKPSFGRVVESSESMWDADEVPGLSNRPRNNALPPISTSGELVAGSKVIVNIAPADNKCLGGKQGTVVFASANNSNVTVQFNEDFPGGHDGSGSGRRGRCWNIKKLFLKLVDANAVFYITEDFKRGKKNLKGMEVKVLANISHANGSSTVVEFEEEVPQGHSADGKGKKAHCLTVPSSIVGKKEKQKPKRPHEVTAKKKAEAKRK